MFRNRSASHERRRRGTVTILVAVCSVVLMGIIAIALDGGLLLDRRRHVQATADAAALAAAADLYQNFPTNNGADATGTARESARDYAAANGYTNDQTNSTVTVNIPPTSGLFIGQAGYAEVIIEYYEKRYFSTIWGTQDIPVRARAVARGRWDSVTDGIIVLDLSARGALNAHGNGEVTVTGAPVIVNSSDSQAAIANGGGTGGGSGGGHSSSNSDASSPSSGRYYASGRGSGGSGGSGDGGSSGSGGGGGSSGSGGGSSSGSSGSSSSAGKVTAPQFDITGSYTTTGGGEFNGTIVTGVRPTADPLRYLPVPNPNTMANGIMTSRSLGGGVTEYTLTPGVYSGGLSFSGQDVVIMQPGIYYMDRGGFSFTGQGSLTANGVMIYNAPSSTSQKIDISGQGTVTLSPPTSGMYQGISIFQDRDADVTVKITGNGSFNLSGTVYAANGLVMVEGNGDVGIGSQYISRLMDVGGNGTLKVSWNPTLAPKTRVIGLVE